MKPKNQSQRYVSITNSIGASCPICMGDIIRLDENIMLGGIICSTGCFRLNTNSIEINIISGSYRYSVRTYITLDLVHPWVEVQLSVPLPNQYPKIARHYCGEYKFPNEATLIHFYEFCKSFMSYLLFI
jgi:hypothetical protein